MDVYVSTKKMTSRSYAVDRVRECGQLMKLAWKIRVKGEEEGEEEILDARKCTATSTVMDR